MQFFKQAFCSLFSPQL